MSDNTVRLKIKVDDDFKTAEVHADDLRNAMKRVTKEAGNLKTSLINGNQFAQAFNWITTAVRGLQSVMHGVTDAYMVQASAETRLAAVMRNTMAASDKEVQSIKDLAAAQQQLGVIGDEVQLSAAQELATYLEKKSSLEKLIPAMNDMIAQQYGYNATAENAVPIATMMGKVMEGQVKALSRYGYSFTDAQEKILKFGTEEEKAATLAEVVAQSVGGVNEALANTREGKLAQANNRLGDIKETAGGIINSLKVAALPVLNVLMEALEGIAARVKEVADRITSSPIATKAAEAMRMIFTQLESLTGKLFSALSPILNVLVNAAGHFKQILDGTWKVIVDKVHPALEKITQSIGRIVAGVVDWITSSEITMDIFRQGWVIIGAISDILSFVFNVLEKIINYVIIPIIRLIDMAYGKLKQAVAWIAGVIGKAGAWFAQKMHPVVEWFGNLQDFVRRIVSRITDWVGKMLNPIIKFWNSISGRRVELVGGGEPLKSEKKETFVQPTTAGGGIVLPEDSGTGVDDKEQNKRYKAAVQAAEQGQREIENALKEQYRKGEIDKEEYERRLEQITIDGLEEQLEIARRFKQDETKIQQQIADAKIQQRENEYKRELSQLTACLDDEELALSMSLAAQEITKEEYDRLLLESEKRNAEERLELGRKYNQDVTAIQKELANAIIQQKEAAYDSEVAALQKNLDNTEISLKKSLAANVITQEQYDRAMLVAKARFYDDMLKLTRAYGKNDTQALKDVLDAQLDLQSHDKEQASKKTDHLGNFSKGWGGIKGIGNSIRDIRDALTETDNAWDALTQTIDGFISLFQSIQQVVEIIDTITTATKAMGAAKAASSAQVVAGNTAEAASEGMAATAKVTATGEKVAADAIEATANTAVAATGAASAMASIPYVGPILAIAAVAAVLASLASLPKFANGGLVYGPTLGLMGEYSGASSNPEVIAPLNRLRALLGAGGGGRTEVEFHIKGRELVGIMNKQNNIYSREK